MTTWRVITPADWKRIEGALSGIFGVETLICDGADPTGEFTVRLTVGGTPEKPVVERAGLLRTARILMDGQAFVAPRPGS